jgi:hypothetical protein
MGLAQYGAGLTLPFCRDEDRFAIIRGNQRHIGLHRITHPAICGERKLDVRESGL